MNLFKSLEKLNDYEIIRKLGKEECFYDYETSHNNLILTNAFLVQTTHGNIDLNLLKIACQFWVRKNPLLGAELFRVDRNERYFVKFKDQTRFKKFDNVELIETNDKFKWKEIMDQDIILPFDLISDPLWRIKFIKITNNTSQSHNIVFILTIQHTITDGRNVFSLGVQLLNIIGALIENKTCEEMLESSIEHSIYSVEQLVYKNKFEVKIGELNLDKNDRIPEKFGDKVNGRHGKMEYFLIESEKMTKLINKMKQKTSKAKLTGFFDTILLLAYKNLLIKHNCSEILNNKFQYYILASVREKLGLTNSYNGVYSSALIHNVEDELNLDTFWDIVEKESYTFHQKINQNQDIDCLFDSDTYWDLSVKSEYKQTNINFLMSNLGIMNGTSSTVLKLVEHYLRMPSIPNRVGQALYNSICSIDKRLCWSIAYNELYYKRNIILELIQEILNLFDLLIDN